MTLFLIIGSILIIFGLLMVISPNAIHQIERAADRIYAVDHIILKHRFIFGSLLVLSASYMIYVYFTL